MSAFYYLKHILPLAKKAIGNTVNYGKTVRLGDGRKYISNKKAVSLQTFQQTEIKDPHGSSNLSNTSSFKVGDQLSGFTVKEVEDIPEFQLTAIKLIHESTGGEYLHINRKDSNNVFCVMFKTTPADSTGLPHILEHTTLCGSKKFPCRDPFFKMLNRSLATYINALTAPDYTLYPFATQNPKDYENLMSIYLDSVFRPLLKKQDFQQEGWRLEHLNPEDPKSPIVIKGVVYNEMKGVFADNQNLLMYALLNNMLPSNTYGVCSGGDPLEIPSLTHADLQNFHKTFYSPFNAKYYSYGNFPLAAHLKNLNEDYLEKSNLKEKNSTPFIIPAEEKWSKPIRKHIKCRVEPLSSDKNKDSSIVISVLCCSITDVEECLLMKVISDLLANGPNSSFYKTLIEPNIGSGFSPVTGYESQTRDTFFTVGLQNVSADDFEKIIQIYEDTIDNVVKEGFDKKNLEVILHSIELNLKHQTSNFGLGLLFSVAPIWNHGGDIIDYLKVETHIENLKRKISEDPEYLQKTVAKYFKNNTHKLILTMSPDENYAEEFKKKEDEMIYEKVKELTDEDKHTIYENGLNLMKIMKKDDKSCLPSLKISDIKREVESVHMIKEQIANVDVHVIPQPTNGITYFRGLLPLANFPEELRQYLPLFASVCTKMGTKKRNYKEFDQLSSLKTGGLSLDTHFKDDPNHRDHLEESLIISSHCLNRNLDAMFDLWLEIFQEMELSDSKRFETLVKAHTTSLINDIVDMGHHYAMLTSASLVSGSSAIREISSGLSYVNFMKTVSQNNLNEVLSKMVQIRDKVINKNHIRCALNLLEGTQNQALQHAAKFIKNIPGEVKGSQAVKNVALSNTTDKGVFYAFPFPISFTGKTMIGAPYQHPDCPALQVMARLLSLKYIHTEVREKGGAYGSGLSASGSGLLNFYSFRDPFPANSLSVFDKSFSWLQEGKFTQEDVNEAKLGLFQSIDAPIPPANKGMRWFLNGITDEMLQKHRLSIMEVTKDKIMEVGEKYLSDKNKNPVGRAVVGPENKSILENTDQNWKIISQQ